MPAICFARSKESSNPASHAKMAVRPLVVLTSAVIRQPNTSCLYPGRVAYNPMSLGVRTLSRTPTAFLASSIETFFDLCASLPQETMSGCRSADLKHANAHSSQEPKSTDFSQSKTATQFALLNVPI